jgi:hypothetical protein
MSIFIELFVSKKVLAQKGQKTLKTQPSKTCLDAKFRYYANQFVVLNSQSSTILQLLHIRNRLRERKVSPALRSARGEFAFIARRKYSTSPKVGTRFVLKTLTETCKF